MFCRARISDVLPKMLRQPILCEPCGGCNRIPRSALPLMAETPLAWAKLGGPPLADEAPKSRLEFLTEALRRNPDDAFTRYALALEWAKSAPQEAWQHFDYLLAHHPDYAATYYQAGMFLLGQGRREEARQVLTKGIEVTRRQGKQHAQSELQAALDDLDDEA